MKAGACVSVGVVSVLLVLFAPGRLAAQPVALVHTELHKYVASPTVTASRSGGWSDAGTWSTGTVPGHGSRVAIPAGVTVTVDTELSTAHDWIRVDGTLRFRPDVNTRLIVETVVAMGTIEIGSAATPVSPGVTARLVIRSPGTPIDHARDPLEVSRGVIAMAPVSIQGAPKKEVVSLAVLPAAGASTLQLDVDPAGWRIGDELVVAPTLYDQDEVVKVTSISGRTVGISPALKYTRTNVPAQPPDGPPVQFKVHVGNLTRNVVIQTDPGQAGSKKLQGHVMFMGGGHRIFYAAFTDLGRTLAHTPVTDPLLLTNGSRDPQLMPECTKWYPGSDEENVRGRYSLHFHNPGQESLISVVEGVAVRVQRNKGFKVGIQNHSGYVAVRRAVVHQIDGSGIMTEEGDERGEIRDSLIVHSYGSNSNHPEFPRGNCVTGYYPEIAATRRVDFGHKGVGIWVQGNQVDVIGNVTAGHDSAGIENWVADPIGPGIAIPIRLLKGGDWWIKQGPFAQDFTDPNTPLPWTSLAPWVVTDNQVYATGGFRRYGLKAGFFFETGLNLERWAPRPKNLIARNLVWNSVHCIDSAYSSWGHVVDHTCVAGEIALGEFNTAGMGRLGINTKTQSGRLWDFTRVRIVGFTDPLLESESRICDVTIDGRPDPRNNCDGAITPPTTPAPAAPSNVRIIR